MGKKLILITVLVFVLMSFSALAALNIDVVPLQNSIYLDEQATFKLTISNPDPVSKVIQIYSSDVAWYVELDPSITVIDKNETIESELRLMGRPGSKEDKCFHRFINNRREGSSRSAGVCKIL